MEKLLRELFYKGCGIKNDSRKAFDEEKELLHLLDLNQTRLENLLDDEGKLRFEKFKDCYDELSLLTECQQFISGFRLGARIVMEVFFGEENFALIE